MLERIKASRGGLSASDVIRTSTAGKIRTSDITVKSQDYSKGITKLESERKASIKSSSSPSKYTASSTATGASSESEAPVTLPITLPTVGIVPITGLNVLEQLREEGIKDIAEQQGLTESDVISKITGGAFIGSADDYIQANEILDEQGFKPPVKPIEPDDMIIAVESSEDILTQIGSATDNAQALLTGTTQYLNEDFQESDKVKYSDWYEETFGVDLTDKSLFNFDIGSLDFKPLGNALLIGAVAIGLIMLFKN